VLAVGAVALPILLRKKPPPTPGAGATISLTILDAAGNPVPKNSPATLIEGHDYSVNLSVRNESVLIDPTDPLSLQAVDATLGIVISVQTNLYAFIPSRVDAQKFTAGQTLTFNYPFSVPMGLGGQTGTAYAGVQDPAGVNLVEIIEPFSIIAWDVIYRATLTLTI